MTATTASPSERSRPALIISGGTGPCAQCSSAGEPRISRIDVEVLSGIDDASLAQSLAPFVYARPNTVGRFTDLPVLMWYEVQRTPRGKQFRYSVIFTNEDGGTATDRLMATWGRTTDIEYVYGAEVDSAGKVDCGRISGTGPRGPGLWRPS